MHCIIIIWTLHTKQCDYDEWVGVFRGLWVGSISRKPCVLLKAYKELSRDTHTRARARATLYLERNGLRFSEVSGLAVSLREFCVLVKADMELSRDTHTRARATL